jgi:hypothetical protein
VAAFSGVSPKRLLVSVLIGCFLGLVPLAALDLPVGSLLSRLLQNGASAVLFPGYLLTLVLSLGRLHDVRFSVIVSADIAIYSILAYVTILIWQRPRPRRSLHHG